MQLHWAGAVVQDTGGSLVRRLSSTGSESLRTPGPSHLPPSSPAVQLHVSNDAIFTQFVVLSVGFVKLVAAVA